ncbi:hypothetical protein HDA32_005479 [Spinactinospora alkalitolerans]|uniref:Uncharacterized protein n=1 Tax=Spinactinospora alkalitolerans TaxID=687207 RepID=A0A852U2D5_9ACTN|nr:hypothetical protein [Spinactinospora alkalitolerans]NYE50359.1 hypothetical protein [Spinactinospora alkalitolerans]
MEMMKVADRNTVIRSLHDLGLAAWFGGSLMGAIGLNGAAREDDDAVRGVRISSAGWNKWAPANAAAVAVHLVGGAALLEANRSRVEHEKGVGASTAAKTVLTGAALAASVYARMLGKRLEAAVKPNGADKSDKEGELAERAVSLKQAHRQLRAAQWSVPVLTGALVALNALHGEQQRPSQQKLGLIHKAGSRLHMGD